MKSTNRVQPYRTERSSLPVTAKGFLGCTARAQSSPSQWPCMISMGLSLSLTSTSKISLSCVPARSLSAFQHTLRMDRPGGTAGAALSASCARGATANTAGIPEVIPNWHLRHGLTQNIPADSKLKAVLSDFLHLAHKEKSQSWENMLAAHLGNLKTSSIPQDLKI